MRRPPHLARLLLYLLPREVREPIAGDLEEDWAAEAHPSARRFWSLTLRSIATCWRARLIGLKGETRMRRTDATVLWQDLRYAARMLRRSPGFSLAVVLTMAIGIGATTAIFSVLHGVVLRALPFEHPQQLVRLYTISSSEGRTDLNLSPANFASIRAEARRLKDVAIYAIGESVLTGAGEPRLLAASGVSAGFFEVLGVAPVAGRTFAAEENQPGHPVTVLGEPLARQMFGSPSAALGQRVLVDRVPRTVIGVMPRDFVFPDNREIWLPREFDATYDPLSAAGRSGGWLETIARLEEGVTLADARAELSVIAAALQSAHPSSNTGVGFTVVPLRDDIAGRARGPLVLLFAAVALVLLIVCANVASLLLARATTRREELAIRLALGAGRGRIVRQLLIEAMVLTAIAGAGGVALAGWLTAAIVALRPEGIPRLDEVALDGNVLAFSAALTVVAGLLVGLTPALRAGRTPPGDVLRAGGRAGLSSQHGARARSALVVAEIALAVVVLAAAGLVLRGVRELAAVHAGFEAAPVTSFRVSLPSAQYEQDEQIRTFYAGLLSRLQQIPGIDSVAVTSRLPLSGRLNTSYSFDGEGARDAGVEKYIERRAVSADYFRTMGIPVIAGREIEPRDGDVGMAVGVISASAVPPGTAAIDMLGRRVRLGTRGATVTVVGVVGDVRHIGLDRDVAPHIYLPFAHAPARTGYIVMRGRSASTSLLPEVRTHLAALDQSLTPAELRPLSDLIADATARPRFLSALLGSFALLALGLAAIGIFGLFSFNVAQRTREIGIRIALGAEPREVVQLVMRNALLLTAIGAGSGIAGALLAGRLLQAYLFGVSARDPLTLALVVLVLGVVALGATLVPARRAAAVDPLVALRAD